jgi:hypothetical protein
MMITRSSGKLEAAKQLEEIRQMNKKNHQWQRQQKEEEDKWKKDKAEGVTTSGGRQKGCQTWQVSAACWGTLYC